jgi:aryl-alcohol dehydrogenase-like predicted oxidoreductase
MSTARSTPVRHGLAPDLLISRVVTGLWQVADLERPGHPLPRDAAAQSLRAYATVGFTTFDMADHYGSAEDIVGHYRSQQLAPPSSC